MLVNPDQDSVLTGSLNPQPHLSGLKSWTMLASESYTHVTADQLQHHEELVEMNAPETEATSPQNVEVTLVTTPATSREMTAHTEGSSHESQTHSPSILSSSLST